MDETKRITRLAALITQLQTKRLITATELSKKFEVGVRTIYRDMKTLEKAGIPLYTEDGKGYRIVEEFHIPPLMFTEKEVYALATAEQIISQHSDRSLSDSYGMAMDKVKAALRWELKDKAQLLSSRTKSYLSIQKPIQTIWLQQLQSALVNLNVVNITYQSPISGKVSIRDTEPFALLLSSQGNWLLAAWCRLRESYRVFRVDGITELDILTQTFRGFGITIEEFFRLSEKNPLPLT
ncbi:MAG TPA: WYL domain-containing protein [Pedobacter sp.]|nr:WYL domain-containing protein [Pedobacter sp.]